MPANRRYPSPDRRPAGRDAAALRRDYDRALREAGVTRDDLALLRDLAKQSGRLQHERSAPHLTRIIL